MIFTQNIQVGSCTVKMEMSSLCNAVRISQLYEPHISQVREQKVYFHFFKRPERYNQEGLSHPFICLPLPYMEGIVLICNIDLYCVFAIFNGTGDMFNRLHFYTLNTN